MVDELNKTVPVITSLIASCALCIAAYAALSTGIKQQGHRSRALRSGFDIINNGVGMIALFTIWAAALAALLFPLVGSNWALLTSLILILVTLSMILADIIALFVMVLVPGFRTAAIQQQLIPTELQDVPISREEVPERLEDFIDQLELADQ
ncbi:MAG: hypothetical protein AAB414_00995 [Patescibacteria group bacterium]